MAYEVELKYRMVDHNELEQRLEARNARLQPTIGQVDIYLRHPCRDFAVSNEALRIRRIGEENRITYKGPRRSGPTKTREEIEITVTSGDVALSEILRLWQCLGFEEYATIRKLRTAFQLTYNGLDVEVALDQVHGLGDFAEVEVVVPSESELATAQLAVLALANDLGLTEVEPRSYLRMNLQARGDMAGNSRKTTEAVAGADAVGDGDGQSQAG